MRPPAPPPLGPRDAASLLDVLLSARLARAYVAGKTLEALVADRQCQDAVVRRLEVLGEAARRVSAARAPPCRASRGATWWGCGTA